MAHFVFVTESDDKAREASAVLGDIRRRQANLTEIQTIDVAAVAAAKAREARALFPGERVLVEDTGLSIVAWNGLPGALVKWFLKAVDPEGICTMMQPFADRRAVATTVVAAHDGELLTSEASVEGSITTEPRGSLGFGWDAIFVPVGAELTFAQMDPEEKAYYSMRVRAFEGILRKNTETRCGNYEQA